MHFTPGGPQDWGWVVCHLTPLRSNSSESLNHLRFINVSVDLTDCCFLLWLFGLLFKGPFGDFRGSGSLLANRGVRGVGVEGHLGNKKIKVFFVKYNEATCRLCVMFIKYTPVILMSHTTQLEKYFQAVFCGYSRVTISSAILPESDH